MRRDTCWLLLLAAGPALGADLVIRDAVVRLESLPTSFAYSVDNSSFQRSGSDYFRSALGVAVGGRYSLAAPGRTWGPLLGGDVALADARSATAHLMTAEVRGVAGLAWQTDAGLIWCAQLAAGIGYGRMTLDQTGGSAGQTGSITPGLGLWWGCSERSHLTLDVGWRLQGAVLHHGDTALDLRQSGVCLAIGVTWGLSRAPWSLE